MPIYTFPDQHSADGNIYRAYGGLRLKKFLDVFAHEEQTNVFSICRPDNFSDALKGIGTAIGKRMATACISLPLADRDPSLPGIQAECAATLKAACDDHGQGNCHDTSEFGCTRFASGLRAMALLPGGAQPPLGSYLYMQCATCPDGQSGCQI